MIQEKSFCGVLNLFIGEKKRTKGKFQALIDKGTRPMWRVDWEAKIASGYWMALLN